MRDDSKHQDRAWWTRPSFVISTALLGLLLVGALVLVITGPNDSPVDPPPPASTPRAAQPPAATTAEGGCEQPAGSQQVPTTAPADTTWELVGSMAAPTAPETYGPGKTMDGFRTCFAHSPTGALYAAVNFWATATNKPAADLYARLAADTPERDAAIEAAEKRSSSERLDDRAKSQVAGFAVLSSTQNAVVVDLAFRTSNSALVNLPTPLSWEGNDWRVRIPSTGTGGGSISDLSGYVLWEGA